MGCGQDLGGGFRGCFLAGDAAVYQAVGGGAGAQAAGAVHAARGLARSEQAGDGGQLHIEHAAIKIGLHAAHVVVHLRPQAHAVC